MVCWAPRDERGWHAVVWWGYRDAHGSSALERKVSRDVHDLGVMGWGANGMMALEMRGDLGRSGHDWGWGALALGDNDA